MIAIITLMTILKISIIMVIILFMTTAITTTMVVINVKLLVCPDLIASIRVVYTNFIRI